MSPSADRSLPEHPSRLRVGDQERDRAAAALGEHYAQGRLSRGEHTDRLDAAWSARTRADLDLLFHDLPVAGFQPTPPPAAAAWGGRAARSRPNPWLLLLAVVASVVVLSEVPVVLVLLLVVAFVAVKRHRRRDTRLAGPPLWR